MIANEGEYEGEQILNRNKIREALGRTDWRGYRINSRLRYRHSFWSRRVRQGLCRVDVAYMQGLGGNHVIFLPSGAIVFRFTEELDENLDENIVPLVRSVERIRSSCD